MTSRNKFSILIISLVVFPIVIAYLNGYLAEKDRLDWFSDYVNQVSTIAFSVSIIGCLLIIY